MIYDFDHVVDRYNTWSLKYDFKTERGMPEDVLPLWVADMDFEVPIEVKNALSETVHHGIFGYSEAKDDYFEAIHDWYVTKHNWDIKKEWLVKSPGVVFALATAIQAFTKEGDSVLIQQPVYYPFSSTVRANNRKLIINTLLYTDGRYSIDFDDFERKIIENSVKLFILCSPQNPVGRVWRKEELERIGDICEKYGVIVVSDEIHADFVYAPNVHHVFSEIKSSFQDFTIVCTAPSKTFNLPGLQISNIFIPNPELRKRFMKQIHTNGYSQLNLLGLVACKAAYAYGESWHSQIMDYLSDNINFVRSFIHEKLPQVHLVEPEGTYLLWLDCKAFGLTEQEREDIIVKKAKLWLDKGTMFGHSGEGFERINIACPRSVLVDAMERLHRAINEL